MKKRIALIVTTCFLVLAAIFSLYANASAASDHLHDNDQTVSSSEPLTPLIDKGPPHG